MIFKSLSFSVSKLDKRRSSSRVSFGRFCASSIIITAFLPSEPISIKKSRSFAKRAFLVSDLSTCILKSSSIAIKSSSGVRFGNNIYAETIFDGSSLINFLIVIVLPVPGSPVKTANGSSECIKYCKVSNASICICVG